MTEPTRDALHAETVLMLEDEESLYRVPTESRYPAEREAVAAMYAYAAECVKRVPELEAEVERLRAKAAVVDAIDGGEVTHEQVVLYSGVMEHRLRWRNGSTSYGPTIAAAYAAATREGTDA